MAIVGRHIMVLVQQAIQICTTMLGSSCTRVCAKSPIFSQLFEFYKEGFFELAEVHLLAAGKRDSARLLAHLLFEWWNGASDPGLYASRGVIPYVFFFPWWRATQFVTFSYLLEGNILAARTFLSHFLSQLIPSRPGILVEQVHLQVGPSSDEIFVTNDQVLNFLQLAIRTCQRAQGDKNKSIRETWVRLCGTYQSKGGLMASPPMRKVRFRLL